MSCKSINPKAFPIPVCFDPYSQRPIHSRPFTSDTRSQLQSFEDPRRHGQQSQLAPQRRGNCFRTVPSSSAKLSHTMSGFYDPNAHGTYSNAPQQGQMSYQQQGQYSYVSGNDIAYLDDSAQWAQAHSDQAGYDYFHPYTMDSVYQSSETVPGYASSSSMAGGQYQYSYGRETGRLAAPSTSRTASRSPSPQPSDLYNYGTLNTDQRTWRCAYPGCNSKAVFIRPCDLRKHFHRHSKNYFCRHEGCPQATTGGFSSRKDRVRHEAKHNPGIECEWEGCERIFSRVDNMKDHLKRIHKQG